MDEELAGYDGILVPGGFQLVTRPDLHDALQWVRTGTTELSSMALEVLAIVASAALETGEYQTDTKIPAGSSYTLVRNGTGRLTRAMTTAKPRSRNDNQNMAAIPAIML